MVSRSVKDIRSEVSVLTKRGEIVGVRFKESAKGCKPVIVEVQVSILKSS